MTKNKDQYFYCTRFARMSAAECEAEQKEELRRLEAGKLDADELAARVAGWGLAGAKHPLEAEAEAARRYLAAKRKGSG